MILEKYSGNIANSTSPITADDILNIKAYFFKHLNNAQTFIHKASFFDKLALVIDKIPTTDWVSIFLSYGMRVHIKRNYSLKCSRH